MPDILETAKELLRKGIALNDPELIQMANSILHSEEKTAQATEGVPEQEYKCLSCANVFSSVKPKKACPKCKKRKLMIVEHKVTPAPIVETGVHEINGAYQQKGKKVPRYNPVTGQQEGSYGRTEQIVPKGNQFVDDGTEGHDGKMFDEKYGKFFRPSKRTKPKALPLQVKCGICSRQFEISPALYRGADAYYVCNRCGSNRRS